MKAVGGAKQKTYVVFCGRQPGIYSTWAEAQLQVNGFSGASYQSFNNRETAKAAWALYTPRWEQNMHAYAVHDDTIHVEVPVAIEHPQPQLKIMRPMGAQLEQPIVTVEASTSNPNIASSKQFVHHRSNGGDRLVEGILIGFLLAVLTMSISSYFKW